MKVKLLITDQRSEDKVDGEPTSVEFKFIPTSSLRPESDSQRVRESGRRWPRKVAAFIWECFSW